MYLPEHTHIPVSRRTPPPTGDAELRDEYKRTLDPFVALAMAAAVTDRILLGTGISLVAQREPIVTAKAVASLDRALRWSLRPRHRVRLERGRSREPRRSRCPSGATSPASTCSRCARSGREESAEFHGKHVEIAPSWSWPKPVSGPPVLIGGRRRPEDVRGTSRSTPTAGSRSAAAGSARRSPTCTRRARPIGRDPSTLRIVPFGTIPNAGKLEYYASLGIEEIVLRVPSAEADVVLPLLDEYAALTG